MNKNTIQTQTNKIIQFIQNLNWKSALKPDNSRLFFYTDGFQLSAAIIAAENQHLKIIAAAQSIDLSEQTLDQLLIDLATQVPELPARSIMLHSRMALGLLDLDIANNKQLSQDKIANIVRWEMETLFNEQAPQWNIGSLLVHLGVISDIERDSIVETQKQNRHRAASFGGKLPRFGEIVISLKQLDQATLDKHLNLQSKLQDEDTALLCGWYALNENAGIFSAAMSAFEQQRWVDTFAENNVRIDRFYPVAGSISSLIDAAPLQCLIELHPSHLVFSLLKDGITQSVDIINTLERSINSHDVLNLISQHNLQSSSILFWGNHPRAEDLLNQLQVELEQTVAVLPWPADKLVTTTEITPQAFLFPLLGVAQDFFYNSLNNGRTPYVEGMPPTPHFYQQKKWQIGGAIFFALLLMLGVDNYYQSQLTQANTDIQRLEKNYKTLKKNNKTLNRENRRYSQLDTEMSKLELSYDQLQINKKAIEENLIERQKFMREFLPLLIKSVDQEVVIDSLVEDSWYQFRVTGWALNLAAVSRFEKALTRHLSGFNMLISQSPSNLLKSGELAGAYHFDFQLVRNRGKQ